MWQMQKPDQHLFITIKGFLLTRSWRDTNNGITLTFWANTERGPAQIIIPVQQAICFIARNNKLPLPSNVKRKPLELLNFNNEPVDGLYFKQQRDLNKLRQHLSYDKTQLYESEIKPAERFLMERFITASLQIEGQAIQKSGYLEFTNPRLTPVDYTPQLSWVSSPRIRIRQLERLSQSKREPSNSTVFLGCRRHRISGRQRGGQGLDWTRGC